MNHNNGRCCCVKHTDTLEVLLEGEKGERERERGKDESDEMGVELREEGLMRREGGKGGQRRENELRTVRKRRSKMGREREERKGQTRRESLTRWSDSHVLLAVHDEAPHRLAIWIVGSSLTYCGWRRRQREGGIEGLEGGDGVVN